MGNMADQLVQLDQGKKVKRWTIEKKLGEGAFGAVYKVSDKTGTYTLKVEGVNEPIQLLKMEVLVLNELSKAGGRHFCKIEDKGRVDNFYYVVMTFVGKSLQDLRLAAPGKKFTVGTAISIGIQCLEALEDLHGIGYLHRDVNPANYTIGRAELKELRKVYVLDFGMARKFVNEDGTIKKPRLVARFRGTVKYAPVACHAQREMCRLDDLESWLYQQIEFTKGALPWRNLEDMDEIGEFKKSCRGDIAMKQLFGGCPREYIDIMRTIDSGRFFDEPNYPRVYSLLRAAKKNLNAQEYPYDWERWEEEPNLLIDSNVPVKTQVLVKHFNSCLVVLKEMFEEWGVVASNGFLNKDDDAILEFSTKEKAELCFNTFHGYEWKGSKLDVKLLKSTQPFGPLPSASTSNIKTTTTTTSNEKVIIAKTHGSKVTTSTDAHEMSKDCCIGGIVDEEKQTCTYDKKPIAPTTTTLTTSGDFNALNKKISGTTMKTKQSKILGNVKNSIKQSIKQTTQNTTNFIVFCLDSLNETN